MSAWSSAVLCATALLACAAPLAAQPASLVYRLGRDTAAIEQFTRTPTEITGDMVQRTGAAVARFQYRMALNKAGRPTSASIRRVQPDGTELPTGVRETRFTVTADSVIREVIFPDSTQRRAFAARNGLINFPHFMYGPLEVLHALRARKTATDSIPAVGQGGGLGFTGFAAAENDGLRLRGGSYPTYLRFDAASRLQSVDGSGTTSKVLATRGAGGLDMRAVAMAMAPTGVLSARETARAAFGPGGMVLVDYGRPAVRERTVWGGTLVPFDSVWRTGANDATHLFTTRPLTFGTLALAPGMYTLWVQHTRNGPILHVNSQTGQWGTQYDATKDVGTVAMQLAPTAAHVEVMQMSVKALGPTRGVLEIAWGPSVASVPFTVGAR
jgi:hypothetical protein